MKVNFVLHSPVKTGGVVVVLEYARQLERLGHEVRVCHPIVPYRVYSRSAPVWRRWLSLPLGIIRNLLRRGREYGWFSGIVRSCAVPVITDHFMPDADVVIATAWPTAHSVARLSSTKGRKFYFIQGYETWHGNVPQVDASYRLPLGLLTIAPWLTQLMREKFGRNVAAEIHNAIDLETFRPPAVKPAGPLTVLMMHHIQSVKGVSDGLAVLHRLHAAHPDLRIRLFGMHAFTDRETWMEHVRNPAREEIVRLYQEAHIFLSPSLSEGWHLPPMEAMACGCAVVATRVGCIPTLESEGNLLSAEPGDQEALFGHLSVLVRDPDLLAQTARKGRATIMSYRWEDKAREFEKAISA